MYIMMLQTGRTSFTGHHWYTRSLKGKESSLKSQYSKSPKLASSNVYYPCCLVIPSCKVSIKSTPSNGFTLDNRLCQSSVCVSRVLVGPFFFFPDLWYWHCKQLPGLEVRVLEEQYTAQQWQELVFLVCLVSFSWHLRSKWYVEDVITPTPHSAIANIPEGNILVRNVQKTWWHAPKLLIISSSCLVPASH